MLSSNQRRDGKITKVLIAENSKLKEEMENSQNELIAEIFKLKEEMKKSQNELIAENTKLNEMIAKLETKKRWKPNLFSCCSDSDI